MLDVVGVNVAFDAAPPRDAIVLLADFQRWLRQHDDEFLLDGRFADIERARREGKLAVFFNIEGGNARGIPNHRIRARIYPDAKLFLPIA